MNLIDLRERLALASHDDAFINLSPVPPSMEFAVPHGWMALVHQMLDALQHLPAADQPSFEYLRADDGLLDFRWSSGTTAADWTMARARARSAHLCEICGATGRLADLLGGRRTLCQGHSDLALSGRMTVRTSTATQSRLSFPRERHLVAITPIPERQSWRLWTGLRDEEIGRDEICWLLGWLQGTSDEADLYCLDSSRDVACICQLTAMTNTNCHVQISDARALIYQAAQRADIPKHAVQQLFQEADHWDYEIRAVALVRLGALFRACAIDQGV